MLNAHYDEIVYGKNYLSLSYAMALIKKNKKVLLIDDEKASIGQNWCEHLGSVEVNFLKMLGSEFDIQALKNIEDFLRPYTLVLSLDENIIELGPSSLDHLNELARKLPECFSQEFIHRISSLDRSDMDTLINSYLEEIAGELYNSTGKKNHKFLPSENPEIALLTSNFLKTLNERDSLKTKELYLAMQMLFQTNFSNKFNELESKYLFTRLLSSQFKVDTKSLCEALSFQFRQMGGSVKTTNVKEWEFYQGKLKSLLLNSFEGVINTNSIKMFTHINHLFPFDINEKNTKFFSLKLEGKIEHSFIKFYKNQRMIFISKNCLGTDFPYAEVNFGDDNSVEALFTYADYPGTKASFHLKRAREFIFERLEKILPGLVAEEWFHNMKLSKGSDVWTEDSSHQGLKSTAREIKMYLTDSQEKIKSIEYWGPLRTQSLGILSYLIEMKEAI